MPSKRRKKLEELIRAQKRDLHRPDSASKKMAQKQREVQGGLPSLGKRRP
jgi:hypothetical protein